MTWPRLPFACLLYQQSFLNNYQNPVSLMSAAVSRAIHCSPHSLPCLGERGHSSVQKKKDIVREKVYTHLHSLERKSCSLDWTIEEQYTIKRVAYFPADRVSCPPQWLETNAIGRNQITSDFFYSHEWTKTIWEQRHFPSSLRRKKSLEWFFLSLFLMRGRKQYENTASLFIHFLKVRKDDGVTRMNFRLIFPSFFKEN